MLIGPLEEARYEAALAFIYEVFHTEQHIPEMLIPIGNHEQKWWGLRKNEAVLGTAAIWKTNGNWHWGRFAVDKSLRGQGLGKILALTSFKDTFQSGIDLLYIDARDTTVGIIEKFGGLRNGKKIDFYGTPVTPMTLYKNAFFESLNKS